MSKRKHISENSNYFLIASHSSINRNVEQKQIPPYTWYLPLAKCFLPGKVSHNREYSQFFNNIEKVKSFVREHPYGFYGPGDWYQDVMISAEPDNNKNRLVHGVIKLPIPTGSNLSNKTRSYNYQVQNLSVAPNVPRARQGQVRLSKIFEGRPGVYIGDFCRIANGFFLDPKIQRAVLGMGRNAKLYDNVPTNNLSSFLRQHSNRFNLGHAVRALNVERKARGSPVAKRVVRAHIENHKRSIPRRTYTNFNALLGVPSNNNNNN
jgi:hypothetical protein